MLQNDVNKSQLHGAGKAPEQTTLYDQNVGLTDKSHIVSFAGYLMPLWYSSITSEHTAVREAAGIFDCTHMGILDISGADAAEFIDQLTTNSITNLKVRHAQYSFILDASGGVLDDVIVYRKDRDKFFVVVNAANNTRIKNWINALLVRKSRKGRLTADSIGETEVCIDPENADRKSLEENDAVGLYYSARSHSQIQQGRKQSIDKGELLEPDLTGKVVSRFVKF